MSHDLEPRADVATASETVAHVSSTTEAASSTAQFTSKGSIPPVAPTDIQAALPVSASDRAFGSAPPLDSRRVTATALNVRSSPEKADNILGVVHQGDLVETSGCEGGWVRVRFRGHDAYVFGRYLEGPTSNEHEERETEAAAPQAHASEPNAEQAQHAPQAAQQHSPQAAEQHAPQAAEQHAASSRIASSQRHDEEKPSTVAHKPVEPKHAPPPPVVATAVKYDEQAPQHSDPKTLQQEYDQLLVAVRAGRMDGGGALSALIKFDQAQNGGTVSNKGWELFAALTAAILKWQIEQAKQLHGSEQPQQVQPPLPEQVKAEPAHSSAQPAAQAGAGELAADTSWTPPANAHLTDPALLDLASRIHDPRMQTLVTHLGGVLAQSKLAKAKAAGGIKMEYTNADQRSELVRGIGVVRTELEQLDGNNPAVAAFKTAVYHELQRIAPYHFQKNIRAIESWDKAKDKGGNRQWSTCNLTSLAMCLELLGISADKFPANYEHQLAAVAKLFKGDLLPGVMDDKKGDYAGAQLTESSISESTFDAKATDASVVSAVKGFRMPDFLQLAAIVYVMHRDSLSGEQGIIAAAGSAVTEKSSPRFLMGMAGFMGASAKTESIKWTTDAKQNMRISNDLRSYGNKHRGATTHNGVEEMNTRRNLMDKAAAKQEHATTDKQRAASKKEHDREEAAYERLHKTNARWLDDADMEKTLALETYKTSVKQTLGPHLDGGSGIIAGLAGHYVRLFAIEDEGVWVQDPGSWKRCETFISWAEARAMGYFWVNVVIS